MARPAILSFCGSSRFLSNSWPTKVMLYDLEYAAVEYVYRVLKTNDKATRKSIRQAIQPDRYWLWVTLTWKKPITGRTCCGVCKGEGENNLNKTLTRIRDELNTSISPIEPPARGSGATGANDG
jgi:hypothetical protein